MILRGYAVDGVHVFHRSLVCVCLFLCLYACAIEPHIVYRSTSLEGHLARCRYNDAKTKEVKADPKKWEVRCRHILPPPLAFKQPCIS